MVHHRGCSHVRCSAQRTYERADEHIDSARFRSLVQAAYRIQTESSGPSFVALDAPNRSVQPSIKSNHLRKAGEEGPDEP
ncbi:hypothetical protein EVG20_g407 [Dentipellis fragilis]|uniref:Uncharacterized protein n=1 Tax=Dentipellis fragilis TaxID=205917 RepID=A0A4Y9ZCW8_9AGAM|nr:hypothetical protein EVG20_g407 [Dentipellis fragilis]